MLWIKSTIMAKIINKSAEFNQLTCFRAIWTFVWLGAGMLICVEFQVLTAFECLGANVAFVRAKITMRDFMLFQCAIRWIDSATRTA